MGSPSRLLYLGCSSTVAGGNQSLRRLDAYEHDQEVAVLGPAFEARGWHFSVADWRQIDDTTLADADLALIRTTWDYQDNIEAFERFVRSCPCILANGAAAIQFTLDKAYLLELAADGLPVIPTMRYENQTDTLFERWHCDAVVIKPRVGAGGENQYRVGPGQPPPHLPAGEYLIQPFLPAILDEGEYSFVFVGGEFSHAVRKTVGRYDYRIQSLYGGKEALVKAGRHDVEQARRFVETIPGPWLAARVDMIRNGAGRLSLIEMETIEPYLYPVGVADFAERFVHAAETYMREHGAQATGGTAE